MNNINITPSLSKLVSEKFKIGIYGGNGSGKSGIYNFIQRLSHYQKVQIIILSSKEIKKLNLTDIDLIVFTGGSASKQSSSLGDENREHIKKFVKHGGNYLGICAGAYLATSGFDWSLGLVKAETISQAEWERGKGFVDISLTIKGQIIFPRHPIKFKIRYSNGPILKMLENPNNSYNIIAKYSSEVSKNNVAKGVMINTPAIIKSTYGKGNVILIGPHPEDTEGLEWMIPELIKNIFI